MKINTKEITKILPVSAHTVIRYQKDSPNFPQPERIGRTNYFDQSQFFQWLNSRATRNGEPAAAGTVRPDDVIVSVPDVGALLDRSGTWVWSNVTKNPEITLIDLSPNGDSQNPRRYFIEREIIMAFPELVELTEAA